LKPEKDIHRGLKAKKKKKVIVKVNSSPPESILARQRRKREGKKEELPFPDGSLPQLVRSGQRRSASHTPPPQAQRCRNATIALFSSLFR
jgi:hypothetical protein